jgi:outer membrane lipoprotein SlyB
MKILRVSALSFALLAACAVSPPDNTFSYQAGNGTVENVRSARVQIPGGNLPGSAAAGGRVETPLSRVTRPRWTGGYQLSLRMDDGATQAITQDSDAFHAGERVQVTPEGRVLKLATAPSAAAFKAGNGIVQSAGAGAADGSQPLTITMDDGTPQQITVRGDTFQPGERVAIAPDGVVSRAP